MPQGIRSRASRVPAPITKTRKLPVTLIVLMSLLLSLTPSAASSAAKSAPANASDLSSAKQPKLTDAKNLKDKTDVPPPFQPGVLPQAVAPPKGPGVTLSGDPAEVIGAPPATTPEGWEPEQEIVERRTATTRTFTGRTPGEFETRVYPEPVNFKQGSRWMAIDSTLDVSKAGKRKSKSNSFDLELADSSDNPELATLVIDGKHSVGFGMQRAAKVKGKVVRNTLTYSRVQKDTDVKLTSTRSGLKEELILSSPQAPDRFVFPLILKGLTASIDEHGDVVYSDSQGKEQARTPHGFMFDSNIDPRSDEPARSTGVDYSLIPHGNRIALEVTLDRQWLDSPERAYPITVDPEINRGTWADDTYVMSPFNADYSSDTELKVGTFNGGANKARSFMHFDTGNLPGTVTGAQLQMRELHSYNCTNPPENVHRVNQQWQGSTMRTFPGASYDSWTTSGSWVPSSGGCGNRLAVWNVTGDVQHWKNTGQTQGSFAAVAGNETDSFRWKKYRSVQAGDGPVLKIWTGYGPHIPSELSPGSHQHQIGPAMQLSARYVDADGGAGMLAFGLWNTAGQMVFNQWSPWICSGCTATMNTPALPGNAWYDLRVAAYDGASYSDFTPAGHWIFNDVRPPDVPTELTPTAGSTVGTSFTASARYREYYGWPGQIMFWVNDPAGNYVTNVYSSTVNHQTVASATINLPVGQYDLYAYGFDGQYSAFAGPHRVSVAGAPGAPTGLNADPGPSSARIRWSPGPSNGSPITRFDLTAYDATTPEAPPASKTCSSPCSPSDGFAFDGLAPGHSYTFRATASNAFGTSPLSAASQPVTVRSTADYAGNVVATPGDREVSLDWEAEFLATSYRIKAYLGAWPADGVPNESHFVSMTEVGAVTTHTFTGLKNGSNYYFTVSPVVLLLLVGQPSAASNQVIPFGVPFAPGGVSALPGNGKSTVLWNPPAIQGDGTPGDNGSALTGYRVTVYSGHSEDPIRTIDVGASSTMAVVDGLNNGTSYSFKVGARNAAGDGPLASASTIGSPGGAPFPPENAAATTASVGSATVTWEPPSVRSDGTPGDNGSPINEFRVVISPACPECTGTTGDGGTHSATVGELRPGQDYVFAVVGGNLFGESSPSVPTNEISFPATAPSAPSAPSDVVAEWIGDSKARVSWVPSNPNGSPVTGYTTVSTPGGFEVESTGASAEFVGLDPSESYTFRVRARNAAGESSLSEPSAPISLASSPPAPPTNVIGSTPRGIGVVELQWRPSDPEVSPATGYTVKIYKSTNNPAAGEEPSSEFGFVHEGSMNVGVATQAAVPTPFGNKYYFVVAARNAAGETNSLPTLKFAPVSASDAMTWTFQFSLDEFIEMRAGGPREDDPIAPYPRFPYSFESDGCSVEEVRTRLGDAFGDLADEYSVYFEPACQRHDFAYQNLGRRLHLKQEPGIRNSVDRQFEQDMTAICANTRPDDGRCTTAANTFWFFVRVFAENGFESDEPWTHRLNQEPGMAPCDYAEPVQCVG